MSLSFVEMSGPGPQGSEWRGTQPGKYTEPWVRESPAKRKNSDMPSRSTKRPRDTHFATLAYDGVSFDVPVRLDQDEEYGSWRAPRTPSSSHHDWTSVPW